MCSCCGLVWLVSQFLPNGEVDESPVYRKLVELAVAGNACHSEQQPAGQLSEPLEAEIVEPLSLVSGNKRSSTSCLLAFRNEWFLFGSIVWGHVDKVWLRL